MPPCRELIDATTTQTIYLPTASGPMPVVAVINGEKFAIQSDHLNTPRRLTDAQGQPRWQWAFSGFGELAPQSIPAAGKPAISYSLRYPGQVDHGNGLYYNFYRFYDPLAGRYTNADPIGLEGGWNRFGYVGGNALGAVDPEGLRTMPSWWEDAWKPKTPTANCATAECRAGLLPGPSENRTPDEVSEDLRRGTCEWACSLGLPLSKPPLPNCVGEIPARYIESRTMDAIGGGICTWLCKR